MGHARLKRQREFPGASHYRDRHGKRRWRYQKKGFVFQLGTDYGSQEFVDRYEAALKGQKRKGVVGQNRTREGTVNALVVAYYKSPKWLALSESSKNIYRYHTEWFRENYGNYRVAMLLRRHIMEIHASRAHTPAHANSLLAVIKRLMNLAIILGMRTDNPTVGIDKFKIRGDGFHTWTEDEITRFYEVHKLGSPAYLAMTLMLWTAASVCDAVKLGSDSVKDGKLTYRRQKTLRVSDIVIKIPIHDDLAEALAQLPDDAKTFIVGDRYGTSISPLTLGKLMRRWCDSADLPQCTSHGLRKACATRLANLGCGPHEIMAWTGHADIAMVSVYTRKANRESNAEAGFEKMTNLSNRESVVVNHPNRYANDGGK